MAYTGLKKKRVCVLKVELSGENNKCDFRKLTILLKQQVYCREKEWDTLYTMKGL